MNEKHAEQETGVEQMRRVLTTNQLLCVRLRRRAGRKAGVWPAASTTQAATEQEAAEVRASPCPTPTPSAAQTV